MNGVQQLGEMLRHYADTETHKKQLFEKQSAHWTARIVELFDRMEQWLAPVKSPGLLETQREAYVAFGPNLAVEASTFKTQKLTIQIAGRVMEFVPEVMGTGGTISISVMGHTAARHGSVSLVGVPGTGDWQWRKTNGLKDADIYPFDADFLALQLQSLIPREYH